MGINRDKALILLMLFEKGTIGDFLRKFGTKMNREWIDFVGGVMDKALKNKASMGIKMRVWVEEMCDICQ